MQIQHENNFLPTSKHRQAKVCRFLGICLYECFIYLAQISSSENGLETKRHLRSGRQNSDFEFNREPIKTREKMLSTDLVNTNMGYSVFPYAYLYNFLLPLKFCISIVYSSISLGTTVGPVVHVKGFARFCGANKL